MIPIVGGDRFVSGRSARKALDEQGAFVMNHGQRLEAVENGYEQIVIPFCVQANHVLNKMTRWQRLTWLWTGRHPWQIQHPLGPSQPPDAAARR